MFRMSRPSRARRFMLSRLSVHAWPAWLVAASLLLGLLPLHSSLEGLERHGALDGPTRVWLTICPPGPARHVEPSTSVELPRCQACVLQLQTIGAALPAPGRPVHLALAGETTATARHLLASAPHRLPASRGPPLA